MIGQSLPTRVSAAALLVAATVVVARASLATARAATPSRRREPLGDDGSGAARPSPRDREPPGARARSSVPRPKETWRQVASRSLQEREHLRWQLEQLRWIHPDAAAAMFPSLQEEGPEPDGMARRLEDAFADAYNTGRPGSTYGYNMFCGSSWAEASQDCTGRQVSPASVRVASWT